MIQYKCKGCGGQLDVGSSGGFECPYCGSKSFMSDEDFKDYELFRSKLLQYARAKADEKEKDYSRDLFWEATGSESFEMANSRPLNIEYMLKHSYDGFSMYVARESVIYIFENEKESYKFKSGLQQIDFPEADDKLQRCFPILKMEINLTKGRKVLVYERRPNFYPAQIFAPWASGPLAWVISRMENICCAFEYSEIQFGDISPLSIFVNPVTHEGAIFGDWRNIRSKKNNDDLKAIRKTAIELAENTREPRQLYDFLNSKPCEDAFEDFQKWDEVIEKGYGGHNFIKMW